MGRRTLTGPKVPLETGRLQDRPGSKRPEQLLRRRRRAGESYRSSGSSSMWLAFLARFFQEPGRLRWCFTAMIIEP